MDSLAYKPALRDVVARLRALVERRAMDRIFAVVETPSQAIRQFAAQHPAGYCADPDLNERVAFWDMRLRERIAVEDDSVPSAYLSELDQGLYAGLFGAHVQFMAHPENGWISSMAPPLLRDWSELDRLRLDRRHPWWRRYQRQLDVFVRGADARFGLSHFILIDGLNFAFELVGATKTYESLFEQPDRLRQAIDLAYEANLAVQQEFFRRAPQVCGGTCSNMVQWVPGRVVSESVDPFHMTSVDCFERWGREPVERMLSQFDGGVLHLHGNGRHLLEAVCSLSGVRAVLLGDDRGFPPAIDLLPELRRRAGDTPLVVQTSYDVFADRLRRGRLPGGVLYRVDGAPSVAAANRLMEQVRAYRAS